MLPLPRIPLRLIRSSRSLSRIITFATFLSLAWIAGAILHGNRHPYVLPHFGTIKQAVSKVLRIKPKHGRCTPEQWSAGQWIQKGWNDVSFNRSITTLQTEEDIFRLNGFQGCASSREFWWHLGVDENRSEKWKRWPRAASWEWEPSWNCDAAPLDPAAMLKDLVENGGILLLGDSVTEGHFFSMSCSLFPHVRAVPDYKSNEQWDRSWTQHLYFYRDSPLLSNITVPEGFDIDATPLVTFRRSDLILPRSEITAVHRKMYGRASSFVLFGGEEPYEVSIKNQTDMFIGGSYATMVISTAGHWRAQTLTAYADDSQPNGLNLNGILDLFEASIREWARMMQQKISFHRLSTGSKKRIIVRPYLPGHDNCRNILEPIKRYQPKLHSYSYNWQWIGLYNRRLSDMFTTGEYQNIHYLPIDGPGLLRPDAHTNGDCLHVVQGLGISEGWTRYIWHYISRELRGKEA